MKIQNDLLKIGTALLLVLLHQIAFAQPAAETPVGRLAAKLINALNSGSETNWAQFINDRIDLTAGDLAADDWLKKFENFHERNGVVELSGMEPGRDPDEVKLVLKSRIRNQKIEMLTHLSRDSSDQLIGFICRPVTAPAASSAADWPLVSLPEPGIVKEIERHADEAFKNDTFSGAILIARNDRVLLDKAYGMADQKNGIPNRTDTKFNVGSLNKMFTSVAIAQLAQAGKLSYDDTLAKILPDYPNQTAARKITIMELLNHTAGLGDFFKPEFFERPDDFVSLTNYLPLFASEPLLFEPGTKWAYSNAGYIVLGLVIEKVSGENYFDYVRNHVFQPAGMTNTDSFERDSVVPNRALGYASDDGDPDRKMPRQANTTSLPVKGSSAGGGYSTTSDLLRFSQALLNHRLLDEATTTMIMTGQVDDRHMDSKYGCGFIDMTRSGQHIVGHNGGGPGISGAMYMLKDSGYVVIVLGNYSPPSADELAKEIGEFLARQSSQNVKLAMLERN